MKGKTARQAISRVGHIGISGTCMKLEAARRALKVIYIWAKLRDETVVRPEHVAKLAAAALKASGPEGEPQRHEGHEGGKTRRRGVRSARTGLPQRDKPHL